MNRGNHNCYDEDEDSIETIESTENATSSEENNTRDNSNTSDNQETDWDDSSDEDEDNEHNELEIPELICKRDKESDDDSDGDDNTRQEEEEGDLYFESSDDEEDEEEATYYNNRMPRLQDRDRADSDSEDEEDEDEGSRSEETNNKEAEESEENEEEEETRLVIDDLDVEDAISIGGRMGEPKIPGMIRISGCNPNGIKANQLQSHLQHSQDLQIDIQCYSEVNSNFLRTDIRQKFHEGTKRVDRSARGTWGTSQLPTASDSEFKPGGTAIISTGKSAGRMKKSGSDNLGRWTYQLLDGQGEKDILIICVYQCCKNPTNPKGMTAYHQQEILLSEMDRPDTEPRRNFYRDLKEFIEGFVNGDGTNVVPMIIGDWNEECKGTSNSQKLCNEFGLVNIFDRIYPNQKQFKTYMRGARTIDFALAPTSIADRVTNFVYEPFLYRLKGDHRAFYFDIEEKHLFGNEKESPYDPEKRTFASKDRKAVALYLKGVDKHLQANNIYTRIANLMKDNEPNHSEAELIDREITRACEHGSNQCKTQPMDYWSIDLHVLKQELSVMGQFKYRRKRRLRSTALIKRAINMGIQINENMQLEEIEKRITDIREKATKIHREAAKRRDEMLLELANMAEDVEDSKKANAIRQLRLIEKKIRAFRRLNFQRKKTIDGGGISRLQVPTSWPTAEEYDEETEYNLEDPKTVDKDETSQWREAKCPKEIEFLLRLRNQRHFGQAETDGTPFTTESMKHKFNWNASTNEAELVLQGEYEDEEITEITRLMLDNLTRITDVDDSPKFLTTEEFKGKFRVWRESTSTSPSGRHLGHYKALVVTIDRSLKEEEREALRNIQEAITKCYVHMINYAIKHKYSLERWKTIVNMMIYKEPGNVKIHRLRVIHIYEADLSLLWGVKWRQGMRKAVKNKTLHTGQYGGLPGRDCTSLTYLEELRLDYSLLTRYSLANFDNDATACYDRILMAIASLAGRKYGIHKDIIFIHAQTLEEAEFKLKLSTKISDTTYRHCVKFPIHGTGQGSSNSPMIWCFISSVLFQSHNAKAHGMVFTSPDGDMVVRFNMVGFVDDSTCITGGNANDTLNELLEKMKQDAQLWHDLLWCSGGKLELPKCGYHVMHHEFENSGIPRLLRSPGESILLTNEHGTEIAIKSKNIYQTRINLGHAKSPAGGRKNECNRTEKKAVTIADAIVKCGCTRAEARLLYQAVWKPAVEYVIPQSFLSEKQLRKIEKASMPKLYACCGFNRNTSRAVLAGPIELGGGGFTPLKVVAGTGYVTHFLKNWRTPEEDIGKKIRIVYAWTAFQAGVTFPLLETTDVELDYVKGNVMPATRKYLEEIGGKIHINNKYIRPKLRIEDACIMERAIDMSFTTNQMERINCVRMYLGVMYMSEICNEEGTAIREGYKDGTYDQETYRVTLTRPKQNKPNKASWKLWSKVLQSWTENNNNLLTTTLGKWTNNHSASGRWNAYKYEDKAYKYRKIEEDNHEYWEVYSRNGTQLILEENIDIEDFDPRQDNCIPYKTTTLDNGQLHGGRLEQEQCEEGQQQEENGQVTNWRYNPMENWKQFLQSKPEWVQELLVETAFYTTMDGEPDFYEIIAEHDKHGHLICVSDGSVKFHNMSFGWILATPKGKRLAGSKGPCRGRGNSLRAEGAGMLSGTMLIAMMVQFLNRQEIKVTCISDNAELIRRCKAHKHYNEPYPNETLTSEFDVSEQIYITQKENSIKAHFKWVKGHQDNNMKYDDLPLEAQLNVDADELAGEYQEEQGQFLPIIHILPSCPAMLSIEGISVTSNYRKQLIRAYVEPKYIEYLQNKFGWSNDTITGIAWKCLKLATRRINRDVLLTKICNDLLPTATVLRKRKYQNSDECVMCNKQETRDHMMLCEAQSRIKWRRSCMSAIRKQMDKMETEPELKELISTAIAEWLETGQVDISKHPIKYATAILAQERIGWRHMFAGKLAQEWLQLQEQSTNTTSGKKRDSYIWGASIVQILLLQHINLWELRNEEVHGKTKEHQERTRKERLTIEVSRLNSLKDSARPSDMFLFHTNEEEYIEESTSQTIATWISSHRKAIANSVKKWAATSQTGITSIVGWMRGEDNDEAIDRIHTRQRQELLDGERTRKERRKEERRRKKRDGYPVGREEELKDVRY
ncbi:hypothetical protein FRACYDRAFT_239817 [Fragilariopsis cylindrus CCMP1102]|uniref:Uncharacterized protein n=1 Tax=Fragilariopsis cylindrus CCMP1102 TaxID=635003 RepID=A0A1E7FAE8_9STRA|nr:hypothetical protein FRACYDRAFT_239817 [Fragilariopsis cylindrus CCMP1102]|eukprot:OEU15138.1 hypothetical protein FRACYDRAFT_239817 [Fragilariopsis cylindrus CCMP1102]